MIFICHLILSQYIFPTYSCERANIVSLWIVGRICIVVCAVHVLVRYNSVSFVGCLSHFSRFHDQENNKKNKTNRHKRQRGNTTVLANWTEIMMCVHSEQFCNMQIDTWQTAQPWKICSVYLWWHSVLWSVLFACHTATCICYLPFFPLFFVTIFVLFEHSIQLGIQTIIIYWQMH